MSIFTKILGSSDYTRLQRIVGEINKREQYIETLLPHELKKKTFELKERLAQGHSLDELLPEAFALAREAAKRTLGQRHFDVQLMGGIVLHEGKIAEMKTGEGKTLAATLPAYLNVLGGKGVHIITVNDYLAKRDAVWMGQIYHALGLTIGCIVHDASYVYDPDWRDQNSQIPDTRDEKRDVVGGFKVIESYLRPCTRREAYAAHITYGTNNEFGFDYLRDNMAYDLEHQVQRGHHFAIIDEVDSILIDEARTPLIISAPDQESSKWYVEFSRVIPRLEPEIDYTVDEKLKAVSITESGINKVENFFGFKDIYQEKGIKYVHHLEQALKAQVLFKRDQDYVVRSDQVIIVDEFTGRLLPGRRYSGGLHQALEAKEGVQVQPESITLASVTFQNYFRMYKKLAGMTGTAATSAEEFHKVYGLDVAVIPTNKPMIRQGLPDRIYKTGKAKFDAVVKEIKERHEKGQPLLIGTASIQKNEYLHVLLEREGIPHEVLNAKNHEREAQIIAQAGKFGAVTVATNMAGRGVDIILGGNPPEGEDAQRVRELGGLHVLGTERHEARRIDNQLRGRAGRQGDPGSSQFFISLEDDLARIFGGDRVKGLMDKFHLPEDQPIENRLISNGIESAQSRIEGFNFDARKHLLEFDDVLNKHRDTIYRRRREILEKYSPFAQSSEDKQNQQTTNELRFHLLEIVKKFGYSEEDYAKKETEIGQQNMRQAEKIVCLRVIDSLWVEHLENMEYLRDSVQLRAYGQQDPLVEYKNEGHRMFRELLDKIDEFVVNSLMRVQLAVQPVRTAQEQVVSSAASPNPSSQKVGLPVDLPAKALASAGASAKVGRNDPCPCGAVNPGTGEVYKYKRCGLMSAPHHKKS